MYGWNTKWCIKWHDKAPDGLIGCTHEPEIVPGWTSIARILSKRVKYSIEFFATSDVFGSSNIAYEASWAIERGVLLEINHKNVCHKFLVLMLALHHFAQLG